MNIIRTNCKVRNEKCSALMYLNEVYNSRRRMHWRIAYEQPLFSHQDEVAASRGLACYDACEVPMRLIAGANDVVDAHRFNIFGGVSTMALRMVNKPALTQLVDNTGHSIHGERAVQRGIARYFIVHEGSGTVLIVREFLTTTADENVENNLSNLPEA